MWVVAFNNYNKPLPDNFTDILTLLKNSFYNCRMLGSGLLAWVWLLVKGERGREVRVYLVTIGGIRGQGSSEQLSF